MRLLGFLSLIIFFAPLSISLAQVGESISDITGENISITLNPQFPDPGDQVEATIDDYSITNSGSKITWFFDGLSAPTVNNSRKITFTAPGVGVAMNIVARLDYGEGRVLEAKKTLS
jgi:hypothetical protein